MVIMSSLSELTPQACPNGGRGPPGARTEVDHLQPGNLPMVGNLVESAATVRTAVQGGGNIDNLENNVDFWAEPADELVPDDIEAALQAVYGSPVGSHPASVGSCSPAPSCDLGEATADDAVRGEEGSDRRGGRAGAHAYPKHFEVSFQFSDELVIACCAEAAVKDNAAWAISPAPALQMDEWHGDDLAEICLDNWLG
jgi:hypothetical protein